MEHIGILFYNDVSVAAVLLLKIYFGGTRRKIIVGGGGTNSDFLHSDGQNIDCHQAYKAICNAWILQSQKCLGYSNLQFESNTCFNQCHLCLSQMPELPGYKFIHNLN